MTHNLYLALGSNLGQRHANIMRALELIDQRVGSVYRVSSLIETEPWGFDSPHRFVNAVCLVHTMLSPRLCLEETQLIEREMGRTRKRGRSMPTVSSTSTCSCMTSWKCASPAWCCLIPTCRSATL